VRQGRTFRRSDQRPVDRLAGDGARSGFSLIELLAVVSIMSILAGIVLASLARVRVSSQSFVCKNKLKTVAFDFIQFADDYAHPWRGDSESLGRKGFRIEDFQERLYGVSEFWRVSRVGTGISRDGVSARLDEAAHPLMCPSGPSELKRLSSLPCPQAVTPLENISIGFNKWLDQSRVQLNGRWVWRNVRLTRRILEQTTVPLAFDVDGQVAHKERKLLPYYSVPPPTDVNSSTWSFWFPAHRHGGRLNAAFIGGHVLSSTDADRAGGWDWRYQPVSP